MMKVNILFLFLNWGGGGFVFHECVSCQFFINTLCHVKEASFYLVLPCFIMKGHCILSNAFSPSTQLIIWVFLYPINMVYYIDFLILNHPCISA